MEVVTRTIDELLAPEIDRWLEAHSAVRDAIPVQTGAIRIDDELVNQLRDALRAEGVDASSKGALAVIQYAYGMSHPRWRPAVVAAQTLIPDLYDSLTATWVDPEVVYLNPVSGKPYSPKSSSVLGGGEAHVGEFPLELGPREHAEVRVTYSAFSGLPDTGPDSGNFA